MRAIHPTRFRQRCRSAPGLSLIELLVVIMIIGVIGSLAMMFLGGGLTDEAQKQRDKRNAQTIASVAAMAGAAGADYFVDGDVAATVENLRTGCAPPAGAFKGRLFQLPPMSAEDITSALPYLKVNTTDLMYDGSGSP